MDQEKQKRPKYDRQFKIDAVELIVKKHRTAASVARDLGMSEMTLHGWKKAYLADRNESFPGNGNRKAIDAEMQQLRRELAIVKEERDILKKAMAVFSRRP